MEASSTSPAVPEDVHRADGFDSAESAGFFVGISRFEDRLFAEVPFAVDDAVDLAHLFALELALVTPSNVVLGLSGEPRKESSRERLRALLAAGARRVSARQTDVYAGLDRQRKAAGTHGLFVAALATHGFSDQGGDFLVAADSLRQKITRTGVAVDEIFDDVARSRAPRRLVLLDACRERLTTARGSAASSPMSAGFARAIAEASGQAVLAGATLGGYAYDDPERRNGVFTATLIEGLRGRAPVDGRGFITVHTLADWAQERVAAWVRDNCPDHAARSQGIARRIEGAAAQLPLAVDPARRAAEEADRRRREAALGRLRENIGGAVTGALYDELAAFVRSERSAAEVDPVLRELEALDGGLQSQRSLAYYWLQRQALPQPKAAPRQPLITPRPESEIEVAAAEDEVPAPGARGWQRGAPFAVGALAALLLASWIATVAWRDAGPGSSTGTESTRLEDAAHEAEEGGVDSSPPPPLMSTEPEATPPPEAGEVRAPPPDETPAQVGGGDVADSKPAESVPVRREPEPHPVAPPKRSEPVAGEAEDGPHGMRFHYVPAGEYVIGSPPEEEGRDDDEARHKVKLTRAFWIAETEATQKQWRQVMGTKPSRFSACGDDCPVERVSWYEALEFANKLSENDERQSCYELSNCTGELGGGCAAEKLYCPEDYKCETAKLRSRQCKGYRLATEAEWEVAARAGQAGAIYTVEGGTPELDAVAWYGGNSQRTTHPVRRKTPNEWGLYDMLGNVWEWTWDWYGPYPDGAEVGIDPWGPGTGSARVVRGGGWDGGARNCRSANRGGGAPGIRGAGVGFRLVRTGP